MTSPVFVPDHPGAMVRPSPNFGERARGIPVTILVLHYTDMESGNAAEDWLCNPESQVSSHYIVHEDARIVQMVPEDKRAWHAGRSSWHGLTDINSRSVGIEIANGGHRFALPPYGDAQIEALVGLCAGIAARHGIVPSNVVAHSDIAPDRKRDPGEHFPWERLAAAGVVSPLRAVPPGGNPVLSQGDEGPAVASLQRRLVRYGLACPVHGVFDGRTRECVEAFQRRFRQALVDGRADASTSGALDAALSQAARSGT